MGPRARPSSATRCPAVARSWLSVLLLLCSALAGCGRSSTGHGDQELGFEELSDTAGLSRGAPILTALEPYRLVGGALRVRGRAELPDGTRLEIRIVNVTSGRILTRAQVTVQDRGFETAPLMGERGPFPPDLYRFELVAQFNPAWQPERVLRATDQGRALRGPGITRGSAGQPAFFLREERRL